MIIYYVYGTSIIELEEVPMYSSNNIIGIQYCMDPDTSLLIIKLLSKLSHGVHGKRTYLHQEEDQETSASNFGILKLGS
jgi:hypothetical protein